MLVPHGAYETLIGAYRLQHTLGHGRMSTLHLALPPGFEQKTVVLTTFNISMQLEPEAQRAFLSHFTQEVSTLATLRHPHIVTVEDYGEQDGVPYFVLPAIVAETLQSRLQRGERWDPVSVLPILRQIAATLDYAHVRGIVHGGLKPGNILFCADDDIRVTGFGVERLLAKRGIDAEAGSWGHLLSLTGSFLGQLEYLAPECIQGEAATFASDVYALGCLLFTLLGGEPPVKGTPYEMLARQIRVPQPSLQALRPRLNPLLCTTLDGILQLALAYDQTQRFQRAGDFVDAYAEALFAFQEEQGDEDFYVEELEEEAPPDEGMIVDADGGPTQKLVVTDTYSTDIEDGDSVDERAKYQ